MKEKIFNKRNYTNHSNLYDITYSIKDGEVIEENHTKYVHASLLIPEELIPHFEFILKKVDKKKIIEKLVKQGKQILLTDQEFFSQKINTLYQDENLNLQKKSFRVEASIWCELKQLRSIINWSVCRIMSFLLYLDSTGFFEILEERLLEFVAPRVEKFFQYTKIFVTSKTNQFVRKFYYRRFKYH
jgi:hypothetical protein